MGNPNCSFLSLQPRPNMSSEDSNTEDEEEVVVMMSVPGTSSEEEQEDMYKTPPERRLLSMTSPDKKKLGVHENEMDRGDQKDVESTFNDELEPVVEENHGYSVNDEVEFQTSANDFQCKGNNIAEGLEMKVPKLPSSFCTGSKVGADTRDGVETSQGDVSRTNTSGGNNSSGDEKSDASGNKSSEKSETEEPSEEALIDNILKVLDLLAKQKRPVHKEKVDIIGSAIKAGITFPRPSWWADDSDDDSD